MSDLQSLHAREARRWADERRFVPTTFGEIAYVERGSGPCALFLHGFPLNGFQWRGVIDRLADLRRCLAPDVLGLGSTRPNPGQPVRFPDQVAMLAEFLDRLGVDVVDVVANDSNTGVAQLFAVQHPERVRSLLLTNGDTEPDSPPAALVPVIELAAAGRFAETFVVGQVRDGALARSGQGLGGLAFTDPANLTDAAIEVYLAPLVASPERMAVADAYAAALAPNPLLGLEQRLRAVQAPCRIVWGLGDVFFSKESATYLDRVLPNSRGIRAIPDAKLFFPEEQPDLIAEEARRLWTT